MTIVAQRGAVTDILALVKKQRNELLDQNGNIAFSNKQETLEAYRAAVAALDNLFNKIWENN